MSGKGFQFVNNYFDKASKPKQHSKYTSYFKCSGIIVCTFMMLYIYTNEVLKSIIVGYD